jgi:peptide/nickel transport system ATP-binding protein
VPQVNETGPRSRMGSIRGTVPSLIGETPGCGFTNRCDFARLDCRTGTIPVQTLGKDKWMRCVLEGGAAGQAAGKGLLASPQAEPATLSADNTPIVAAEAVACSFKVRRGLFSPYVNLQAVKNVSLTVRKGEVVALVGESGCGKTTLARVLLGIQPFQSGQVMIDGRPLAGEDQRRLARRVQPVFQDPYSSLNPRRTVGQIIRRPLDIHDIDARASRDRRVREMMELVGLPERMIYNYPSQLSGGQRQRVAIARAIVINPELVICDEPTSALDVSVQAQILNLLLDLRAELGLAYLLITHDLAVVRQMADRIIVMYLGEVVESGPCEEVFHNPRHPYTRALMDSLLTLSPGAGIPDNHIGQSFPNPLEPPSGCTFHPRCPKAMAVCSEVAASPVGQNQVMVRCHLYPKAFEIA